MRSKIRRISYYTFMKKFNHHDILITMSFSEFTFIKKSIRIVNPILNEYNMYFDQNQVDLGF